MSISSISKLLSLTILVFLFGGFFSCTLFNQGGTAPFSSGDSNSQAATATKPGDAAQLNSLHAVRVFYGFWPYWISPATYQPDWSVLSYVSYFSMDVDEAGGLDTQYIGPEYYTIRDTAHSRNVKVTLTVTCFDNDIQDTVLAYHQSELINNILTRLRVYKADGVNIDFEGVRENNSLTHLSNTTLMENFLTDLYTRLKKADPGYHISFCVTGGIEQVYRNAALSKCADAVLLMGYDYHWSTSPVTGAIAPYGDPDNLSVDQSLNTMLTWYPVDRLILGLPFYGYDWPCESPQAGAKTLGEGQIVYMQLARAKANLYGRLFDDRTNTPWYRYWSRGAWHQCWYDDEESYRIKFDYIKSSGISGVGFWALGYEGSDAAIWNTIRNASQ